MTVLKIDTVLAALGLDTLAAPLQIVPAAQLTPPGPFGPPLPFVPTRPLLIAGLEQAATLARVQSLLQSVYPADHPVRLVRDGAVAEAALSELGMRRPAAGLCAYLAPLAMLENVRSFEALRYITARLRAPGGCPWDRQQTHESLKPYVLEETYEVLEALDSGLMDKVCEELGDLMLQVMIQSQVAVEAGEFSIDDVVGSISAKLVRRHPHVFGDVTVSGAGEVLRNWEAIKQGERKAANGAGTSSAETSFLAGVPAQMPALAYAQRIQERAGRAGFDAAGDLLAQAAQLEAAQTAAQKAERYGELLFAAVTIGRRLGVNPEDALRLANRRFRERFIAMERLAEERGKTLSNTPPDEQRKLWVEVQEEREG